MELDHGWTWSLLGGHGLDWVGFTHVWEAMLEFAFCVFGFVFWCEYELDWSHSFGGILLELEAMAFPEEGIGFIGITRCLGCFLPVFSPLFIFVSLLLRFMYWSAMSYLQNLTGNLCSIC